MSLDAIVADLLLALAVLVVAAAVLGVVVMRDVYQKMHYLSPLGLTAPILVALAVSVQKGWYENTTQSWLTVMIMAIASPVLTHATMRAARLRDSRRQQAGSEP